MTDPVRLTEVAVETALTGYQTNTRVSQVAVEAALTGFQANTRLGQFALEVAIGPQLIFSSDSGVVASTASISATVSASDNGTITEKQDISYIVTDTFDRVDNATTLGTTSDGATTWTTRSGTMGISSNTAYAPAVPGMATITSVQSDGTVQVTVSTFGTTGDAAGLAFRATDSSNFYRFVVTSTGASLIRTQAGVVTVDATWSGSHTAGDVLSVVLNGTSVTCLVNGSALGTVTESFNISVMNWGIYADDSSFRLNDFSLVVAGTFDPDVFDSGSATESVTLSTSTAASDSGAVVGTEVVTVGITSTDTGTTSVNVSLALSGVTDAETASSTNTIAATLTASDAYTAADTSAFAITASDTGTASTSTIIGPATTDSGSISQTVALALSATDTGTLVSSQNFLEVLTASDSGVLGTSYLVGPRSSDGATAADVGSLSGSGPVLIAVDPPDVGTFRETEYVYPDVSGQIPTLQRWAFADPLGNQPTYWFAVNPNQMSDPDLKKSTQSLGISPLNGKSFSHRAQRLSPREWTFNGTMHTKAQHDTFYTWFQLNQKIWLHDHFNRLWEVRLVKYEPTPRASSRTSNYRYNYTFTVRTYRRIS